MQKETLTREQAVAQIQTYAVRIPGGVCRNKSAKTRFHVVRLDYGVRLGDGAFLQTHHFSKHNKLDCAIKTFLKTQQKFNCVAIVDSDGYQVKFDY